MKSIRLWILAAVMGAQPFLIPIVAEEKPLQLYEQKIKAGLVYNLLKYTTWPKESTVYSGGVLQLCMLGDGAFNEYLEPLQGRTAQQSSIAIHHLQQINEAKNCNVIVIHSSIEDRLPELLTTVQNKHILTIGDVSQFAQNGGMVEMSREEGKVILLINKEEVERAGLVLDERIIKLAKVVRGIKVVGEAGGLR